jgi:aminoacrylate hydrolase
MIAVHNDLPQLGDVRQPKLVVSVDENFCTPLPISEEIARAIPGSEFVAVPDCGHLIENEREDEFLQSVSNFIGCHRAETGRWL